MEDILTFVGEINADDLATLRSEIESDNADKEQYNCSEMWQDRRAGY